MSLVSRLVRHVAIALCAVGAVGAAGRPADADANAPRKQLLRAPGTAIADRYIVVLNGPSPVALAAVDRAQIIGAIDRVSARYRADVAHRYSATLRGFAATMSAVDAAALAQDPDVAFVQEDSLVHLAGSIQANAGWNLDRIDQADLPLDTLYTNLGDGDSTTVYVIDTGVRATHTEFAGRILPGFTAIQDGRGTGDCQGHGTHVAGTAVGTTVGIAKRAHLVPVRVFGCGTETALSSVIAGIDWVAANKRPRAVANLSISSPADAALDQAIANLAAAGVTVIVAAGNEDVDACTRSPSRVPAAITVGATAPSDARATFSNWGACVDVSAPGVGIVSASYLADVGTRVLDGTSMATPAVAGAAAAYLGAHPGATPAQIAAALIDGATANKIIGPKGSPNRLLSTRVIDSTPPRNTIVAPASGAILGPTFDLVGDISDPNLIGVQVAIDGQVLATRTQPPYAFTIQNVPPGPHTLSLIATDLAGHTSTSTVTITVQAGGSPDPSQPEGDDDPITPGDPDPDQQDELTAGCSAGGGTGGAATALALGALAWLLLSRRLTRSLAGGAAAIAIAACCGSGRGEGDHVIYIDSDGDGTTDSVDTDGDGLADVSIPNCPTCLPGGTPACSTPLVDVDNDGLFDGLDLDCDGVIDIPFDWGSGGGGGGGSGGGGGGESRCVSTVVENTTKKQVSCTSTGATATCECRIDDALVQTCSAPAATACSIPNGNCCGF